ncbi:hypothetical protein OUZ56_033269, partial [Daphnia magna]
IMNTNKTHVYVVELSARWPRPARGEAERREGKYKQSRLSYKDYNMVSEVRNKLFLFCVG